MSLMKLKQRRPFPTEQDWAGEVEVDKNDEKKVERKLLPTKIYIFITVL